MKRLSAGVLLVTIAVSVSVMWVKARWATAVPEIAACSLAAVWMILFALGRRPRLSALLAAPAGVALWAGVQILAGATVYRWQTAQSILYWAGNFSVFFASLQIFGDRTIRERFLRALLLFGFIVSVVSTLQAFTTNGKVFWLFQTEYTSWYVFGPFVYTNQYAAFIELLLPVALYGALTDSKWRVFDTLIAAVMYASVLASASRTGSILTTLEIFAVPLLAARRFRTPARTLAAAGGLLAGMVVLLAVSVGPALLIERFGEKNPYTMRREFLTSSLEMVKATPLIGVGLGNWATAYPGYALFDDGLFANQAHNDWAQWTVEGGIPLTLLMLWLAVAGGWQGLRSGWGAGIAAIFLHCLDDYPIQRMAVALVLFALLGAVVARPARELYTSST